MALKTAGRPRGRLSMTSLIDVIFLLLLFFMLSSTFTKYGEIELTGGLPGGEAGDAPVRFIRLDKDRLLLNGRPVTLADLLTTLRKLAGIQASVLS